MCETERVLSELAVLRLGPTATEEKALMPNTAWAKRVGLYGARMCESRWVATVRGGKHTHTHHLHDSTCADDTSMGNWRSKSKGVTSRTLYQWMEIWYVSR